MPASCSAISSLCRSVKCSKYASPRSEIAVAKNARLASSNAITTDAWSGRRSCSSGTIRRYQSRLRAHSAVRSSARSTELTAADEGHHHLLVAGGSSHHLSEQLPSRDLLPRLVVNSREREPRQSIKKAIHCVVPPLGGTCISKVAKESKQVLTEVLASADSGRRSSAGRPVS